MVIQSYLIQHFSCVCCRQTEPCSGFYDGCGRETNDYHANVSFQHLPAKCTNEQAVTLLVLNMYEMEQNLRLNYLTQQ